MYYWLLVIILKCIIPKYSFHCEVYANEIYGLDVSIYMLSTVLNILLQGVDVYIPCNISMEFRTCLKPSRTHLFMHTQTHTLSETNHPEKRIAFGWNICTMCIYYLMGRNIELKGIMSRRCAYYWLAREIAIVSDTSAALYIGGTFDHIPSRS